MSTSATSRTVRIAPDWLPNTNHLGIYVALERGYYADAGLDVRMLPFDGEAMPNRKIVSGEAEFGLMPHQSLMSMRARGTDVVSVAALVRPNTTTLMVRADAGIARPADLAGRRYASFGTEFEVAMVNEIIRRDGGTAGVRVVATEKEAIHDALLAGETDVAWGFFAWEGIQAELAGVPLRHFFVAQHGLPAEYFPLLFTPRAHLDAEPETVGAVVRATARGYADAARDPDAAADLFLRAVPAGLLPPRGDELVRRSARWLAPRFAGPLDPAAPDAPQDGEPWGWHDRERWYAFAAFLRRLARDAGATAPEPPEPEAERLGYTNAFIAG